MPVINLKLPQDTHEKFHEKVKESGSTMQSVLAAFVASYIENPEQFKIKLEVGNGS